MITNFINVSTEQCLREQLGTFCFQECKNTKNIGEHRHTGREGGWQLPQIVGQTRQIGKARKFFSFDSKLN
jgi:hypothetical protein